MGKPKENIIKLIKITYFDEAAAQDYIDIANGGRLDWNSEENKKKVAQMLVKIEAEAQAGFNIFNYFKASISGNGNANMSRDIEKVFDSTLKNTLLTEYISKATEDVNVKKFDPDGVYAPENSVSMYKMYSSYLSVVPKEQLPIDMEKLNEALLGERGYYAMLLLNEQNPTSVLRFNIKAFNNNYNLADLSKMKLAYYGVKVGSCTVGQLSMEKEFENKPSVKVPTAESIIDGDDSSSSEKMLDVYDIVLAGVLGE